MLEAQRGHLRGHVVVVQRIAVVVFRIDRMPGELFQARLRQPARQADGRYESVRHVVLLHVQQVEEHAGVGAEAEAQRRRDAPTRVVDLVATGHVAVLPHRVQAQRTGVAQRGVPVGGGALLAVGAGRNAAGDRVAQVGLLGHHVDRAGRRRTAGIGAGRTLHHFDLVDVEQVARHRAEVAHAIDEDAAGAVEAAHVEGVAGAGGAVFASVESAHARAVAQRFGQGRGALLLEQFLADHLDGLRCVLQGLGELGRDHEAVQAVHFDLVQRLGLVVGGRTGGHRLRRGRQRRPEGQAGQQGGGRERSGRRGSGTAVFAALDRCHVLRVPVW